MNDELPPIDGEIIEKIDRTTLRPLWDDHEHKFTRDGDDETDSYFAEMCEIQGCGLGRLVAK